MRGALFTARVPRTEPRYSAATLNAEQRTAINADLDAIKGSIKGQGKINTSARERGATVEGIVRTALMAKGQQDSFVKALEFRIKRHHEESKDSNMGRRFTGSNLLQ